MNRENDWMDCLHQDTALEITPDVQKAKALQKTAQGRIIFMQSIELSQENVNYVFEAQYTSALEYLHAHLCEVGYKITNHLCIGFYLKEELKRVDLQRLFDDCRQKRNKLQYYGKTMDFKTATKAIQKCNTLINEIKNLNTVQLSEQTKKDIEQARKEFKQGKSMTHAQAKKELNL